LPGAFGLQQRIIATYRFASNIVATVSSEIAEPKNPDAVALGRLGDLEDGKAGASKLTPEQNKEIVKKAVLTRWKK
jgi:hypothetical protein